MDKSDCFYLGKITKPFGFKGEMVLFLDVDDPLRYNRLETILVDINDQLIPFHIEKLFFKGNKVTVRFLDVNENAFEKLIGKDLYLPLSLLPKLKGKKFYFHEVIGFTVVDEKKGPIGILENILDYPAQDLFQIQNKGKEILIPAIDEIIHSIDRESNKIHISAPEGLIDLYMTENISNDELD